jgi:hypothetical protein
MLHLLAPILLAATLASPASGLTSDRSDLVVVPASAAAPVEHAFWDRQNDLLFTGVAAARAFDFFTTRRFRDKHLKEWLLDDETVDNRPLFAAIEIAGTAVSIGTSYLLHRAGYHRLERWASILHITFATAGGIWNCTLPNGL